MPRYLSSRPSENEDPFVLNDLSPTELELIAALLCNVRLGNHSAHATAAYTLMEKITDYMCDDDYVLDSSKVVDMHASMTDRLGWKVITVDSHHFEIEV
jgi:hypothetical protein